MNKQKPSAKDALKFIETFRSRVVSKESELHG